MWVWGCGRGWGEVGVGVGCLESSIFEEAESREEEGEQEGSLVSFY